MRNYVYQVVRFGLYWPAAAATGLLGGVSKVTIASLKGHWDFVLPVVTYLQGKQWLSLITALVMASAAVMMKAIGPPWVKDAVKHVLDAMSDHGFGHEEGRERFYDRVTLFKYHKCCWRVWAIGKPWGGFLIPYARSGHFFTRPSVVFRVPANCDYAQGVAGQAYVSGATLVVENLPDVSRKASPSAEDFKIYSVQTWVAADWLQKERSTARALLAMRVLVNGKPWGAIVVDTRAATIPNQSHIIASYTLVAKVLGELLDRS